jgi:hypothetical protein
MVPHLALLTCCCFATLPGKGKSEMRRTDEMSPLTKVRLKVRECRRLEREAHQAWLLYGAHYYKRLWEEAGRKLQAQLKALTRHKNTSKDASRQ